MDIWTFGRLIKVALKNPWLFSEQVFAVFSNLGGNYEEILVTLLGKASLWADPEGSFQVLSTRLELCHPLTLLPAQPQPLWLWRRNWTTDLFLLFATREGTLTSQLTVTLWHTNIFSHTPPTPSAAHISQWCAFPPSTFMPQPSRTPSPLLQPSCRLPSSRERFNSHIDLPPSPNVSGGLPDVLVYITECSGRVGNWSPWLCLTGFLPCPPFIWLV